MPVIATFLLWIKILRFLEVNVYVEKELVQTALGFSTVWYAKHVPTSIPMVAVLFGVRGFMPLSARDAVKRGVEVVEVCTVHTQIDVMGDKALYRKMQGFFVAFLPILCYPIAI